MKNLHQLCLYLNSCFMEQNLKIALIIIGFIVESFQILVALKKAVEKSIRMVFDSPLSIINARIR